MIFVLYAILYGAVIMDLYTYKVKNWIIIIGLFYAFSYHYIRNGYDGIIRTAVGIFITFFILYSCYLFHVIGAGDVKLFCIVGGLLSLQDTIICIALSFFIGSFFCIIYYVQILAKYFPKNHNRIQKKMRRASFKAFLENVKRKEKGSKIHFTISIFFSVLLHMEGLI